MSRKHRPLTRYLAIALAVFLMPVFAFATAVAVTGTVSVRVHERGDDGLRLYLPVPALLVDLALVAAPWIVPDAALADARRELAPYRDGLDRLAAELEACPSGLLVDVDTPEERVRVSKRGRSFEVEVDSDDVDVWVRVPARLVGRALDLL